ncbi:caspase, EACC1-associated type [Actinomadura macra]|uniref:caspase, EACC1-associated type n=1 Tax=Actinomadura macra TaxID=46164 RepID=UPI000AD74C44|nr:YDG/SRA domain-containing protein [Actinomadura macra]
MENRDGASQLPDPKTSRVVLIGVSSYDHLEDLPAVENNLKTLSEILQDKRICGLAPEDCTVVHNPLTAEDMLDPIKEAAAEATDVLLVYFAGHGILHSTSGTLHLARSGTDRNRMYTAVDYDHVRQELRHSRAARIIAILDCCHSGQALNSMGSSDTPSSLLADGAALTGTCLLASSSENAASNAGGTYTAFTGQLIDVARKGIPGCPAVLSVDDIFLVVREALQDEGLPIPQRRESDHGGSIALFRNQHSSRGPGEPAYGPLRDARPSSWFPDRRAVSSAGIHRPLQAGICGTVANGGAESIVVSGGYEDDRDFGDVIVYTGHGGRDPNTGEQIKDQVLKDSGNAALVKSMVVDMPIRVVRGAAGSSKYSPKTGYSYDGLFRVTDAWIKVREDGFKVWQYLLKKTVDDVAGEVLVADSNSRELQKIYDCSCQICGQQMLAFGHVKFAMIQYIRPLGFPHDGLEGIENALCLCSNHRDLFRYGTLIIEDDFTVVDQIDGEELGVLTVKHEINVSNLQYHRERYQVQHDEPPL